MTSISSVRWIRFVALFIFSLIVGAGLAGSSIAAERSFRLYTVEVNGTKFWIPSTVVVKKGDTVKIAAATKLEGAAAVHGFSIPDFKVEEVVDNKGKSVTFKADRAGIFPITCHLHAPHVGSQLVVLD